MNKWPCYKTLVITWKTFTFGKRIQQLSLIVRRSRISRTIKTNQPNHKMTIMVKRLERRERGKRKNGKIKSISKKILTL